jgi:hypothetical protein
MPICRDSWGLVPAGECLDYRRLGAILGLSGVRRLLGLFGLQLLLAFTVTAFGVMVAVRIKQIQTFTSVMQMLVMPLLFLSGALYPVSGLPTWLDVLNRLNPLTYAVDPMRRLVFDHLDISDAARRSTPASTGSTGACPRSPRWGSCWRWAWR